LHFNRLKEELNKSVPDICACGSAEPTDIRSVVLDVVASAGKEKEKVIEILQDIQKRLNYIPSEALKIICEVTDITPGQISGVATFFSQFRLLPVGQHIIKVCAGTACHVKGSQLITESFRRALKLNGDEITSPDRLFSIEEVACLGCCTLAPVVQIDGKTYGHVKPTEAETIIANFLESKNNKGKPAEELKTMEPDAEIRIGLGSCCVAGGSREILSRLLEIKEGYDLHISIKPVGCVGVCNQTPLLEIVEKNGKQSRYTNVRRDQVEEILLTHIRPVSAIKKLKLRVNEFASTFVSDELTESPINLEVNDREKILSGFLSRQVRLATEGSGVHSPVSIDEYILFGGFSALAKTLKSVPAETRETIKASGLRGRGGAGFPTGKKWDIFAGSVSDEKYIVCNGDEGDPGAFMDRMLLESFPFRVIEGMIIAGISTGAKNGIFYIRAEYPLAVERVRKALKLCYEKGILGKSVQGTLNSFDIRVFEGAGAFVCGEETALIASLEGRRGTPNFRPPYPAEKGFMDKPTLVNNVETLSLVPWIINNGADKFSAIGTEKSKGTKVFALAGKISKGGLIEVPMGITIREIVEGIGQGVGEGRKFKAVQIGGPSGGCIPASLADTPVDFEELSRLGAMMGSGGLVVLDDADCMIDMAKYFLTFTHRQSCGKCTFCRIGTKHMLDILTRLSEGKADMKEIDTLEELCNDVKNGSLCGLGKTAPNPVITGLKYFREEYEAHANGYCPSKKCRDLVQYSISDKCTGCTRCYQDCPVGAIAFKPYEKHEIDQSLCTKCDNCRVVCRDNAIEIININGGHKN
jgi:NADH-quinone oxidoreductase subunit F